MLDTINKNTYFARNELWLREVPIQTKDGIHALMKNQRTWRDWRLWGIQKQAWICSSVSICTTLAYFYASLGPKNDKNPTNWKTTTAELPPCYSTKEYLILWWNKITWLRCNWHSKISPWEVIVQSTLHFAFTEINSTSDDHSSNVTVPTAA